MGYLPKIFDILRALAYLVLGCFLIFSKQALSNIVPAFKITLAIILLLYGTYRLYQVYIKHFKKQDEIV